MCEVHFIMNMGGKIKESSVKRMMFMLRNGYGNNKDGFGLISDKYWYKSIGKIEISEKDSKEFLESSFLIGHNRSATHGTINIQNCQPIIRKETVVVHNGMFYNSNYNNKKSDTVVFTEELEKNYLKCKDEIMALKETIGSTSGWYSMFIFFHRSKRLFYIKESGSDFMFFLRKNRDGSMTMLGSTKEDRIKDFDTKTRFGFEIRTKYMGNLEPEADMLYEIDKMGLRTVCEIEGETYEQKRTIKEDGKTVTETTTTDKDGNRITVYEPDDDEYGAEYGEMMVNSGYGGMVYDARKIGESTHPTKRNNR